MAGTTGALCLRQNYQLLMTYSDNRQNLHRHRLLPLLHHHGRALPDEPAHPGGRHLLPAGQGLRIRIQLCLKARPHLAPTAHGRAGRAQSLGFPANHALRG